MNLETLLLHGVDNIDVPGVVPSIELSTTFLREGDGSYPSGFSYARRGSPLRKQLEVTLAQLEGGTQAFAFSSGMAAISSLLQLLRPNDEVLIPEDCYYATRAYLETVLSRWHIHMRMVDMTNLGTLNDAISASTKMIWVETPSNPMLKITDLREVAALCKRRGLISICDSTVAGPVIQKPLSFGFDYVVHSLTKSLNGHSDVLGGVVIQRQDAPLAKELYDIQVLGGAVLAPFDCWLVLRGLKTLVYRVEAQTMSAMRIATWLASHPRVGAVYYPGLNRHPGHTVAASQMRLFGSLMSFQLSGNQDDAMRVVARARLWSRATSLGSVESLIEHRASMEDPQTKTPRNLIRLSVGLEQVDDLISDLEQALG